MAAHLPSEPVVRVPASEAWLVKRVLDAGARTLMFPNIESAADAAHAVRLTQYPSAEALDGQRGVAGVVRASGYGMRRDYVQTANAQIASIVQIESARGLRAVEEIAIVGRVLHVDQQPVETRVCERFGGGIARERQPQAEQRIGFAQTLLERIGEGAHRRAP
jgi:2-keto-3-deoxy-L-rhamnonate aldolase RhmA